MVTKGYGFSVNDIDWSSPTDLKPYEKAHMKQLEEQDLLQHMWWGRYGLSAVAVAVEHCIAGRKASSEYIKEPILMTKEQREMIAKSEMQNEVDKFFAEQKARRLNWKRNHKDSSV